MSHDLSFAPPRPVTIRYGWDLPSPIRLLAIATVYAAAAVILMLAVLVLFAVGTAIGGTVLTYKALRWVLGAHRPRFKRLPAAIRQAALAADGQEAQLLATSALHRLIEDALSVEPGRVRRNGRRILRRVSTEARELVRLLAVMQRQTRFDASLDLRTLRRLSERAEAVSGYARRSARANSLGVDRLWLLERERASLSRERDLLIDELVAWRPARPS
jgi:hypothetical protein